MRLAWLGVFGVAVPTLTWGIGGASWVLDLGNHFVLHALLVGVAGAVAALALGRSRIAAAFVVVSLPCALRSIPSTGHRSAAGETARVMVANVLASNPEHQSLLDAVDAAEPDVVALLEVTPAWADDLVPLAAAYPFSHVEPRSDCFGIAVFSKVPLQDLEVVWLGDADVPSLVGTLPGGTRLVVTHPLPPVSADYAAARDLQLAAVAEHVRGLDRYVVVGDLNATPWSSAFPDVEVGWTPGTWPAWLPAPLRIPIDHVLLGPAVTELARRVGPDVGSDHRPLIVDLQLPSEPGAQRRRPPAGGSSCSGSTG